MPGYTIHLATGMEYLRKYEDDIKNKKKFLKGIIAPDDAKDKLKSHYGKKKEIKSIINFLEVNKEKLNDDYIKGYFLHLYADYLMYFKYFPSTPLYSDYDKTNKYLIEKYKVKLPLRYRKYGKYSYEKPENLTYKFLDKFINEVTVENVENIMEKLKGEYYEHKN